MNFLESLLVVAESNLDQVAIKYKSNSYSYCDLFSMVFNLASKLCKNKSDYSVCIVISENSFFSVVVMLACFFSGVIYCPVSVSRGSKHHSSIFQSLRNVEFVFISQKYGSQLSEHQDFFSKKMIINESIVSSIDNIFRKEKYNFKNKFNNQVLYNKVAYIMFTSGSTGVPKGVPISYKNLDIYLTEIMTYFNFFTQDHFLQLMNGSFDLSLHEVFTSLLSGGVLYIYPDGYAAGLLHFIVKNSIQHVTLVPSLIPDLLDKIPLLKNKSSDFFSWLRQAFFCGETLPISYARQFNKYFPNASVINLYGPTEATVACSYHVFDPKCRYDSQHSVPIGFPFSNTRFELGEKSELLISGEQLFSGYINQPSPLKQAYKTGDILQACAKFGYYFLGRMDDQWQIYGCRIEKSDLEAFVKNITGFHELYILPIYNNELLITSLAVFTRKKIILSDYYSALFEYLPSGIFPLRNIIVSVFPRLPNQKIDNKKLASMINSVEDIL